VPIASIIALKKGRSLLVGWLGKSHRLPSPCGVATMKPSVSPSASNPDTATSAAMLLPRPWMLNVIGSALPGAAEVGMKSRY
jgi:hypothetical protein